MAPRRTKIRSKTKTTTVHPPVIEALPVFGKPVKLGRLTENGEIMQKLIAIALVLGSAAAAHADGFECTTRNGDLNVKVYNHTQASAGTRNAAVMVVSDPSIGAGKKTTARFTDIRSTLTNSGADYVAAVDLSEPDSSLGGRNIGGTKLSQLSTIELAIEFKYNQPVSAGEYVPGTISLNKSNGEVINLEVDCTRYLKQQ